MTPVRLLVETDVVLPPTSGVSRLGLPTGATDDGFYYAGVSPSHLTLRTGASGTPEFWGPMGVSRQERNQTPVRGTDEKRKLLKGRTVSSEFPSLTGP